MLPIAKEQSHAWPGAAPLGMRARA